MKEKTVNKLKNLRVYLAGNMDHVADGGENWRNWITPLLRNMGMIVLDPCKKEDIIDSPDGLEDKEIRERINALKSAGDFDSIKQFKSIRTTDLRCVDISDVILVYIDLDKRPCGTWEEVITANREKKPIIFVCKQGKTQIPNWMFWTIPHEMMFSSLDEALSYLNTVDSGEDVRHFNRWMFFNLKES